MGKARFRLVPLRILPGIDWLLILLTLALAACGLVTLWGATSLGGGPGPLRGYALKQLIFFIAGLGAMTALIVADYHSLRRVSWILYLVLLLMLLVLLIQGHAHKGARSWFSLGFFNFQPSEPGKLVVIMVLAQYLAPRALRFRGIRDTFRPLALVGAPAALILVQPDLGSALVFVPITAAMFWVAGLRRYVVAAFALLAVAVGLAAIPHLKPHQVQRINTFIDPGADPLRKGYHIMQSKITLGSGQLVGKGWGRGTQTNLNYLPEFHTDFIFPTVGEQFGLAGCAVSLALMLAFVLRMIHLANVTQDLYGVLVITGVGALFCTHIVLNIGMTIGLLPVTGLPLPFFSYGGTFVLTCMMAVGLTIGIGARREL